MEKLNESKSIDSKEAKFGVQPTNAFEASVENEKIMFHNDLLPETKIRHEEEVPKVHTRATVDTIMVRLRERSLLTHDYLPYFEARTIISPSPSPSPSPLENF